MKKQELLDKIKEIGTCEDDVRRRTLLSELEEESGKDYDELERIQTENQNLTAANETLRDANMKLFLRVGERKKENEPEDKKKETAELKYENLFDEKGELK